MQDNLNLLKTNKSFGFLWASQILSQLTVNGMNFLLLIRLFAETSSTMAVSMLWLSYSLPVIFLGPIASSLVDRTNKRQLLVITNLFQAITVFFYALTFGNYTFLPFLVAMVYSTLNQFYLPAESASIPLITKKEHFSNANSLFLLTQQGALVISAALATSLNHLLGFRVALFICAGMLFLAFISTLQLPSLKLAPAKLPKVEESLEKFFLSIFDGVRFIIANKLIFYPITLIIVMQIMLSIITVSLPQITQEIMGLPATLAGLIIVPAVTGSLLGALFVPKLIKDVGRKIWIIKKALIVLSLAVLSLVFLPFIHYANLRLVIGSLLVFLVGGSYIGIVIPAQTFLQEQTPKAYFGRVFGNLWFLVTILTIIPLVTAGALAEIFSIRVVLLMLSIGTLTICLWGKRTNWGGFVK
jgi:MFS family permease